MFYGPGIRVLTAGCLASLFWKPAYRVVDILAKIYLWLALLVAVSFWILYFLERKFQLLAMPAAL